MNTVEEIEQAAEQLAPSEFDRLALWGSTRYHDLWKRQMERDAADGKLDFLFNEADGERGQALFATGPLIRNDVQACRVILSRRLKTSRSQALFIFPPSILLNLCLGKLRLRHSQKNGVRKMICTRAAELPRMHLHSHLSVLL